MNRSLPLNALQVFDVAASELSFARAAERLFVTHGAVSRQIRTLETALGLPLFERRNRAVFLTPAGARLHATTRQMFEQLDQTVASLRPATPSRTLVVSCEPTLAMRWLIPRLGDFQRAHPGIELHLHSAGGPLDLAAAGVDVAIRRNDFFWGHSLVAAPLGDEWIGPVGLPAQFETPTLRQLHTRTRPQAWHDWRHAMRDVAPDRRALPGRTTPRDHSAVQTDTRLTEPVAATGCEAASANTGGQQFEHFYLSLQAAGAGLGVAIGSVYMVADELAAGRLVAPHGFVCDRSAYVALARSSFDDDAARATLLGWLQEEMAKTAAPWISA